MYYAEYLNKNPLYRHSLFLNRIAKISRQDASASAAAILTTRIPGQWTSSENGFPMSLEETMESTYLTAEVARIILVHSSLPGHQHNKYQQDQFFWTTSGKIPPYFVEISKILDERIERQFSKMLRFNSENIYFSLRLNYLKKYG